MPINQKEKAALCKHGKKNSLRSNYIDVPREMREQAQTWVLWKYTNDGRKMPDDWTYTPGAKYKGADSSALHLSFDEAVAKLSTRRSATGIGLYLGDGVQLAVEGRTGWLWCLDLDGFAGDDGDGPLWEPEAIELWKATGKTYAEVSPSGTGLKLFFVSDVPPVGKQVYSFGTGQFADTAPTVKKYAQREVEVFCRGYYVTVTGRDTAGTLRFLDAHCMISVMQWLDEHGVKKATGTPAIAPLGFEIPPYIARAGLDSTTHSLMGSAVMVETEANIEQVRQWLEAVDADCDYESWRNLVWSVASLEWDDGQELARHWSKAAADRYDEAAFDRTWHGYRPGSIGVGTLVRAAQAAGYKPSVTASSPAQASNGMQRDGTPTGTAPTASFISPVLATSGWVASTPRFNLAELTADKLFVGTPPKQEWLCEGVFPAGKVCVLASPPGVGKSFLALDLACKAVSASSVSMAFGGMVRGGGRAVYVSAEDDVGELHRRLHPLMAGATMPERLHVLSLPDVGHFGVIEPDERGKVMRPTQSWQELVSQVKALPDVRLIVLDTLQAMSSGDTNAADAVQPLMNECSELAAATGATVLLLHHVAKGSTKEVRTALDAAEAIRGSGAIVGSARSAYVLWPPPDGGLKICAALGEPYIEGAVAIGLVAKANGAACRDRTYFLRDSVGLLQDVTQRYLSTAAANEEALLDELVSGIERAWHKGASFAAAARGQNGVHTRRHELPVRFHELPGAWFESATGALLNAERISRVKVSGGFRLGPTGAQEPDK